MNHEVYPIAHIRKALEPIAQRYGISRVYLFGSYARGDATPQSDIDLCIDKGRLRTALQLGGFYMDAQEALQKPVDVVTTAAIDGPFKEAIERDGLAIYG